MLYNGILKSLWFSRYLWEKKAAKYNTKPYTLPFLVALNITKQNYQKGTSEMVSFFVSCSIFINYSNIRHGLMGYIFLKYMKGNSTTFNAYMVNWFWCSSKKAQENIWLPLVMDPICAILLSSLLYKIEPFFCNSVPFCNFFVTENVHGKLWLFFWYNIWFSVLMICHGFSSYRSQSTNNK